MMAKYMQLITFQSEMCTAITCFLNSCKSKEQGSCYFFVPLLPEIPVCWKRRTSRSCPLLDKALEDVS